MHKQWFRAAILVAAWASAGVPAIQAQHPVVCMGDSITQGRAEFVAVSYPIRLTRNTGAPAINAGVGGMPARHGLAVVDTVLSQFDPSYVLILYGTNDINDPGVNLQNVAYVVLQTALRVRARGAIPVIGTIPPMVGPRAREMSRVRTFNNYLRSYAAYYGIRLADIQAAFGSGAGLFVSDGFHPNDSGMEIIARTFGAHVPVLLLAPTSRTVSEGAAAGQAFAVTTGLPWTTSVNQPWISIVSGQSGSGGGSVVYDVAENIGPARSGIITVLGANIGHPFTVSQAASPSLKIESAYGTPNPAAGTIWTRRDTATNASVAGSPIALGVATQIACVGWTGAGSAPKTGTNTETGPFTLTNATTVTWQWRTNVWLETAAGEGGTVSAASGWYLKGSNVAVRALPAAGFKFARWSGASASTAEAIVLGMTSTKSLFAEFAIATNYLAVASRYGTPAPAGTNWMRKDTTTNASVAGSPLAIGVSTQYVCVGWTATGSAPKTGTGTNTGSFVLTNNTAVTWQWRTNVWLEMAAGAGGSVSVASGWFGQGSNVAVRALPAAGFKFARWSGASASTAEAIVLGMTSTKSLFAEFAIATNSLSVASRYGTPAPAGTNWMRKDTTTNASVAGSPLAVGVSTQLVCVGWTATGSAPKTGTGTDTGPFVLTNNTAVTWQWRTNVWLETAAGEGGTVSVASGWFGQGSNVAVRALPAAGFKFAKWSGASASTAEAIVLGMTSTKSLFAEFAIATNSLSVASRYGTPAPAGTNWMRKDTTTNASVAGSPLAVGVSTQYVCVGWTATGSAPKTGTGTDTGPFVLTNNTAVTWQWRTNVWLETAVAGSGTVNVASGWIGQGSNVALRATPAAGSRFFRWTGAWAGTVSNATVAMASAKSVTAWFGVDVSVQARGLDGSAKVVAIRTTTADVFQVSSGTTPCKFGYTNGTVVGLNAPASLAGGWKLVGWTGVDTWEGTNATWTAQSSNLVTALYDPAPTVAITNPTVLASWTTTNRTLNLKGRAAAVGGLVRIEASNARAERNRICAGTTNWSCEGLALYPGTNPVTVTAYDAYTNATTVALAVTCSSRELAQLGLALLSGAVIRDIQMPDNLVPGSVCAVRWQVEAYEPVRSGLKIRLPEGPGVTNVTINGRLAGTAPGSWTLGEWGSKIYSFEADWTVPHFPGTCRIRFLTARQDGYAYFNANIPAGMEALPFGTDGKEIARTIADGGTVPALQNEALAKDAKPFDTMIDAQRRAGVVVRNVELPDNLSPGSVATCRWTLLSYPAVLSRLRFDLPSENDALGAGTAVRTTNGAWQVPADGAIVEYDGTATNDAVGKVGAVYKSIRRDMQYVWTVPNDPGTCRISFETALAAGSNWIGGILREGVDGRIETNSVQILRDIEENGAAPTVLEPGTTNATGNIQYAGDADWYEFATAAAGTYRIQTTLGTLTDTILKLYGPGNRNDLIGQNDNAVGLASRLVLPLEPGTYYVKITAPPTLKGTYKLVAAPAP